MNKISPYIEKENILKPMLEKKVNPVSLISKLYEDIWTIASGFKEFGAPVQLANHTSENVFTYRQDPCMVQYIYHGKPLGPRD